MKTPTMKKIALTAAIASITSASLAGPLAPLIDPLAGAVSGTPLSMVTDQLGGLDAQLETLSEGGSPSLDALPVDPAELAGGLEGLPVDPNSLPGGGLPSLDALPIDPASLAGGDSGGDQGGNPLAGYTMQFTNAVDEFASDIGAADGTVDALTDVVDALAEDPAMVPGSIQVVPSTLETAFTNLQANLMAMSGGGGDSDSSPFDPATLADGGMPSLDALPVDPASFGESGGMPGLDALPLDPESLAGGGGMPGLDALPIDPASLAGDGDLPSMGMLPVDPTSLAGSEGLPSLDALPIDPASLSGEGGDGENPFADYATQFTFAIDELAADLAGSDGTIDAVTDVIDALATDPASAQGSIEAVPSTIERAATNLQANLMALSGADSEDGDSGEDAAELSLVLTTPAGVLTADSSGPSFE
ncbi:hypothetical protein [Zhongshania sp.]|uniref:hypothetical protein n=1 Tax=Zhongshania sp. TaxID=1971902 RepID=UPI003566A9CC